MNWPQSTAVFRLNTATAWATSGMKPVNITLVGHIFPIISIEIFVCCRTGCPRYPRCPAAAWWPPCRTSSPRTSRPPSRCPPPPPRPRRTPPPPPARCWATCRPRCRCSTCRRPTRTRSPPPACTASRPARWAATLCARHIGGLTIICPDASSRAPSMHADIATHCSAVCGEACSGCCYWPRASGSAVPGGGPAPANYSRGCWRHRPAPPRTPRNICPQLDMNVFN